MSTLVIRDNLGEVVYSGESGKLLSHQLLGVMFDQLRNLRDTYASSSDLEFNALTTIESEVGAFLTLDLYHNRVEISSNVPRDYADVTHHVVYGRELSDLRSRVLVEGFSIARQFLNELNVKFEIIVNVFPVIDSIVLHNFTRGYDVEGVMSFYVESCSFGVDEDSGSE